MDTERSSALNDFYRNAGEPMRMEPQASVLCGVWRMKDKRPGKTLHFNLYAAPTDLQRNRRRTPLRATFNKLVKCVAALKDWHGHSGGLYRNFKEIERALAEGSYKGEWFIPDGVMMFRALKHAKDFVRDDAKSNLKIMPHIYATSKEYGDEYRIRVVNAATNGFSWAWKEKVRFSCRPMRLELIP